MIIKRKLFAFSRDKVSPRIIKMLHGLDKDELKELLKKNGDDAELVEAITRKLSGTLPDYKSDAPANFGIGDVEKRNVKKAMESAKKAAPYIIGGTLVVGGTVAGIRAYKKKKKKSDKKK